MKDSLLDIRALSARLAIPVGSIRNALWRGQAGKTIPVPIRLGRRLRWSEADVERFLDHRKSVAGNLPKIYGSTDTLRRGRPTKLAQLKRECALKSASAPAVNHDEQEGSDDFKAEGASSYDRQSGAP